MKFLQLEDTLYNFDKFIGLEVVDNSTDSSDSISILFRFEGDYLHSFDEENTPYTFSISMSSHQLTSIGLELKDVQSVFENDIHGVLKWAASDFIERFTDELESIPIEGTYIIDLGYIKRKVLDYIEKEVKESNEKED